MRPSQFTTLSPQQLLTTLSTATLAVNASRFQVSLSAIRRWRLRLAIPAYYHHQAYAEVLAILQAHPEGLSGAEIARVRGVSRQAAHQVLTQLRAEGRAEKQGGQWDARWVLTGCAEEHGAC